jgi:hypothetical protein
VARGLASLGVKFSEEAVEPVTGYRVDLLLHCFDCEAASGHCAVEVGKDIIICVVVEIHHFVVVQGDFGWLPTVTVVVFILRSSECIQNCLRLCHCQSENAILLRLSSLNYV